MLTLIIQTLLRTEARYSRPLASAGDWLWYPPQISKSAEPQAPYIRRCSRVGLGRQDSQRWNPCTQDSHSDTPSEKTRAKGRQKRPSTSQRRACFLLLLYLPLALRPSLRALNYLVPPTTCSPNKSNSKPHTTH